MADSYDLVIVGGGVTGYGAAVYAGRFRMKTLVIAKEKGGLITWTHIVENYPGFQSISGYDLAKALWEHAEASGAESVDDEVIGITRQKDGCFLAQTKDGKALLAKALLLATGTKVKTLGIPGEKEFHNKGVHYCATCDGALYQGKTVAIIGGSDSAAKEALLMTEYCPKVYLIFRGEDIKPEPINKERVLANQKIELVPKTNVLEYCGDKNLKAVKLDRPLHGKTELALDAAFVAVGHIPLSGFAKTLGCALNEAGEIKIDASSRTNVRGVFAAGDVVDTEFKQAITGVAEGVWAVYEAYKYIKENEFI